MPSRSSASRRREKERKRKKRESKGRDISKSVDQAFEDTVACLSVMPELSTEEGGTEVW